MMRDSRNIWAIEACAAAQAIDFLAPLQTSPALARAHAAIRRVSAKIEQDRMLAEDFVKVAELIRAGALAV